MAFCFDGLMAVYKISINKNVPNGLTPWYILADEAEYKEGCGGHNSTDECVWNLGYGVA